MNLPSLSLLLSTLMLFSCTVQQPPLLERIKEEGELVVVTRKSPTTYFEVEGDPRGLEYDLVTRFAASLGVTPRFVFATHLDRTLSKLTRGEAHLAASGLIATEQLSSKLKLTSGYQKVSLQLVYRAGAKAPKKLLEADREALEVVVDKSHFPQLQGLQREHPKLLWKTAGLATSSQLLQRLSEGAIDYTVASSSEVAMNRHFHPELRVSHDLSSPRPLVWAFPRGGDSSLLDAAQAFLEQLKESGKLDLLIDRYYGHSGNLDYVGTHRFRRHVKERLPPLIPYFKQAARETGIEWQLLAAIGYQESHWDPSSVSPTGVRGIMMLTRATAKQLGIKSRTDPKESILGGARYLRIVEKKIPERIPEPDRLWMTLAGYNVGFGHLEDARILTQRMGGNPDRWSDVRQHLPLLSDEAYYKTLRRGYARGREPVTYVDNVRSYYDLLVWANSQKGSNSTAATPSPALPGTL